MHRWFDLAGADNTRDLGGMPTSSGRLTRHGVLLRSDTLQELTPADVVRLRQTFGLRTVLDLRAEEEVAHEGRGPLEFESVAYHHLSFLPGQWVMPGDPRHAAIVVDLDSAARVERYLGYLRLAGDAAARAVRLLAQPTTGPALFHCAAGKDRTGVLAALVLDIVGVDRESIISDYTLTNERIALVDARLARRPSYRRPDNAITADSLSCRPEVMRGFLDAVDRIWGGPTAWALHAGVTEADLHSLRTRLVE
ncbi:protein tyrosine phosphatase [Frankia sp. CcI49]|uniref:tyrosine-protein phosphatase n=1 Tax=unclassified Frankia TaxID=2632575 RepID=UPI0006C9EF12|nr:MULTISPECIES: tyrosine-protein phosphatase [unclassified Frankia]KPM57135.1 protein tyrosine phosphatase [Frankia sp. R43]ONH60221.1 protein tyrosine phosphatase [Frankia sp. CcI49]